jgi:hypothetical protein
MLVDEKPKSIINTESILITPTLKEMFTSASHKELTGHKKRVYTIDWNVQGTKLASGSVDCSIRVKIYLQF